MKIILDLKKSEQKGFHKATSEYCGPLQLLWDTYTLR